MMKIIAKLFKGGGNKKTPEYVGFSDFFLRAPVGEKKKIIAEAARKANEDQLRVFNEARFKVKTN